MKNKTILFTLTVIIFSFFLPPNNLFGQNKANATADLIINSFSPEKDSVVKIGVLFKLEKDWHIYWRNSGDSGIPTSVEFILPNGLQSSCIQWPIPSIFSYDTEVNFGYDEQVMLLSDVLIPTSLDLDSITITAKIEALLCKYICIPFDTILKTTIDLTKGHILDDYSSKLFKKTEQLLPILNHRLKVKACFKMENLHLILENPNDAQKKFNSFVFMPYEDGIFKNSVEQKTLRTENQIEVLIEPAQFRTKKPDAVEGILVMQGSGSIQTYEIKVPISF